LSDDARQTPRDIERRTFNSALKVVHFCHALDAKPGVGWALSKQLLRAGTSIGANVEEAQAGQSRADFISKNAIALKEARETAYWLRLIHAAELVASPVLDELLRESDELARILGAIVCRARQNST
jgi:four helix bundle protein